MIDVEKYVPFLVENKLTQEQVLAMYLIHLKKYHLIRLYKSRFINPDDNLISQRLIDDLEERGFIIIGGENADEITVTNKFTKIFDDNPDLNLPLHDDLYEITNAFWKAYPAFVTNNGKTFPLTLMDKNEFRKLYISRIKGKIEEHRAIMKDLDYAKDNGLIFGKIEMFVKAEQWEKIREVRSGGLGISEFNSVQSHDFN